MSTAIDALTIPRLQPYRPAHHPKKVGRPLDLPAGLDDGQILRLRAKAERMARRNNVPFPMIFAAKVLAALSEAGKARLSPKEIIALADIAAEMPAALSVTVMCFVGAHPPLIGDYKVMAEMIRAGAIGGTKGLCRLHQFIADRLRKRAENRFKRSPMPLIGSNRPKLQPLTERIVAKATREQEEAKKEIAVANEALNRLYARRLAPELKRHVGFIEAAMALRDAGYGLVERHRHALLEIAKEV